MATIATSQYLDNGTARTAGEAHTINSGAVLTVRTDTRVHANAPTLGTGSFGSLTINEGEFFIDARNVRWLAYTGGSGNSPAIGTTITQGGVSGYYLGAWANLTSLAVAAGAAIPATGFIKFREVTGGNFTAGALTGIAATASASDVTGWIEVVHDQAATLTVPRLGKYTTRGTYFYLDNTTGTRGQVLQTPTNGGGANTYCAGVEIETAPGSNVYDLYPALNGATNGWAVQHIGQAKNESDIRQKFVKMLSTGQMQIGEQITQTGTYAYLASQTTTYASNTRGGYYWREGNKITVYCSGGHYLTQGMQTGIDFTSGTAVGIVATPTVLDAYYFEFDSVGANTEGTCNCREGVTCTFTAHGLNIGEKVYLTPTTGTLPAGLYEIYAVTGANTYMIKYPHLVVLTSGSTGALHTITVTTSAAHGLAVGNRVYLDFTSGTAVDGAYTIRTVPTTTTYTINCPLSAATSGNFTSTHDLGYVPVAGCKTRIPNIITRECSTGTRATNNVPNATLATRPEFATTSAGALDIEYLYNCNWYMNLSQPYSVSIKNSFDMDSIQLTECATPYTLDTLCVGSYSALDVRVLTSTSNFAGGTVRNCNFMRSNTPGPTDHNFEISYCNNITIENSTFGITQYVRSTGYPLSVSYSDNININNCTILNGPQVFIACSNSNIMNLNYCDRIIGYTNATSAQNAVTFDIKSSNCTFDGITYGYGVIPNCHPAGAIFRVSGGSTNSTARNLGTPSAPLNSGTWQCNLMNTANIFSTSGNNNTYRIQRAYVDNVRTGIGNQTNADKNTVFDTVMKQNQYQLGTYVVDAPVAANLNCNMRGFGQVNATTGSASVYGLHWSNNYGMSRGRLVLHMNEPTTETISGYSVISGTPKFNSSGGVLMYAIGDSATWETYELKGITGFNDYEAPLMSGGTLSNHLLEYQIDTGSGYSEYKNLMRTKVVASGVSGQYTITIADTSGLAIGDYLFGGTNLPYKAKITNIDGTTITLSKPNRGAASGTVQFSQLPSEVCNPAYTKLKVKISTIVANVAAIMYVRLNTLTSWDALTTNLYPLDTLTLTLTGLVSGSDVVVLSAGTETVLDTMEDIGGSSYGFVYEVPSTVDIRAYKPGYFPFAVVNYALGSTNASLPIVQVPDVSYLD